MTVPRKLSSHFGQLQAGRVRSGSWTALAVVLLTTVGVAQRSPNPSEVTLDAPEPGPSVVSKKPVASARSHDPGALPPVAQAQISAAIGEDERAYHAIAQPLGFRMENPNNALSAEFAPTAVAFRQGANRWGMALRSYGYGDTLRETTAAAPTANGNRVEYRRGALTEWYVNGPLGLEQGFTLARAPAISNGEPLTFRFALSGNLTVSVAKGARALTVYKDGAVALRYGGLTAWDADRREIRTWLEVEGDELRIRVDDSGARYPLTIDPFVQAPKLTTAKPCDLAGVCDDGAPGDQFGFSVSISADASTVVVGVPFKYTNSLTRGAAYVFLKPTDAGGWNSFYPNHYKTKLLASDGATNNGLYLGFSVDISRDGGTIVAGARRFGTGNGAAYIFVRPGNGWGTNQVQTQTAKLTAAPASNSTDQGSFGHSATISGDGGTIVVGAPGTRPAR